MAPKISVNVEALKDYGDQKELYVAYHNDGFFDEIQRMFLAYLNKQPSAIEGEPGLGKNHAIKEIARATGNPMYRIRCTEEMTARDIIGGERLEAEKSETGAIATKTVYAPGKLFSGMKEGAIVVLDEFNQLNPTVQKALNSALEDVRTVGYIDGNEDVDAKEGFGIFITYNPQTGVAHNDLEPAVRDRCKVLYFEDKPKELKLRIALLRSGKFELSDLLQEGMEMRGINKEGETYRFAELKDKKWKVYGLDEAVTKGTIHPYLFYDNKNAKPLEFSDPLKQEYYQIGRAIVNSLEEIKALQTNGTKDVRRKFGLNIDEISRLNIIPPSQRLVIKLIEDYAKLRELGYSSAQTLGAVSKTMTDATVPAGLREQKIGENTTIPELIKQIASSHGIVDNSMLAEIKNKISADAKKKLIEELMSRGYIKSVAEGLVNEYSK